MSPRHAATKTTPTYRTGLCQVGNHHLCKGEFRFVSCGCTCHTAPAPEPPPPPAVCAGCGRPLEEAARA